MSDRIESRLKEDRRFPPSAEFSKRARLASHAAYASMHRQSLDEPEVFWRSRRGPRVAPALEGVLRVDAPEGEVLRRRQAQRHRELPRPALDRRTAHKAAIIWEGEPGEMRTLTYFELHREVVRLAAALVDLGVKAGDRVAIYMGMVPETAVAMLACARIGAPHSVVFGGFSVGRAARPDQRLRGEGAAHAGRRVAARRVVPLKKMADERARADADASRRSSSCAASGTSASPS